MFLELKEERGKNANLLDVLNREQQRIQHLQKQLDEQGDAQNARIKELENTVQGKVSVF